MIDGYTYEVTSIRLHASQIMISARGRGPQAERHGVYTCTVFGDDGTGIYQADLRLDHPACRAHDDITIVCRLRLAEIINSVVLIDPKAPREP